MTSKMHAGLVAGGFGAALAIGLVLSAQFFPLLAYFLAVALLFGLGALSGVLAARWLDLNDYGRQHTAGAIAGLVAASLTEVADLILRLVFASISQPSPTSALANLILMRLPAPSPVAQMLFMILVNLLLYLLYLLVVIGISSAFASIAGRAKTVEALQTLLSTQQPFFAEDGEEGPPVQEMDPALVPFMRPEYSPFVPDEPPPPVSPWRQRRQERGPTPERQVRYPERDRIPPTSPGQTAPRNNSSGSLSPSGVPARGRASGSVPRRPPSGAVPRRSPSGLRPPPNAQWPRPQDKD